MNAAVLMETCPSEEILAAFIDGRLDEQSRQEVIRHLADCGDCRDVVVTANEYGSSVEMEAPVKVAAGRFGPRVLAPLLAAAAVVAVVFGVPSIRERILPKSGMAKLVDAANALPERPFAARLSGDFAYHEYRPLRGSNEPSGVETIRVEYAAAESAELAQKRPTARNLHAAGVGSLLTKDRNDAVAALERAAKADPSSAEIQNDLAAAYLARGNDDDDYARALAAAQKSWAIEQTPAAAWNIALALQYLDRPEAGAAWRKYLALDESSEWAREAREKYLQPAQ